MADQCVHVSARGGIPDFDGRVGGRRGDEAAIGRDADLRDWFGVSVEDEASLVIGLGRLSWRSRGRRRRRRRLLLLLLLLLWFGGKGV